MNTSNEETKVSGRTPSMLASLLVFGVMIGLILLSVFLFPEEVDAGPLQISMTLATLFALGVAYRYGFHGALITEAITHSINSALGTIFILLAIGALIGSLYLAGTVPINPAEVQNTISQVYHNSVLAFVPVILIFVLSALHLSGFITSMISAIAAVIIAAFTQPELIKSVANDPSLHYTIAATKVGIETFASGFHLDSGIEQMDHLFSGGGTYGMLPTVWLILVAASFGAVAELTGMIQRVIGPVISLAKKASALIIATSLTSIGLNIFAADPYVSIVLTVRMYRETYIKQQLKPEVLSTVIADSGSMISYIVPWNVHGAFVIGALGVGLTYMPFAFLSYLSPLVTVVLAFVYLNKRTLPGDEDAEAVYGTELKDADLPVQQLSA